MNKIAVKKIGIWLLVASLLLVHILFRNTVHAQEPDPWREFQAREGECSIFFPVPPNLIRKTLKIGEGQHLHYEVYLAPFENKGIFMLLIATYPHPLPEGHEIAGLEGLLKGIVGEQGENHLVFANLVDYGGRPAMNFLVQSPLNYFRGQVMLRGNKLFLVAMEGRKIHINEEVFIYFVDSFKLQNP